MQWLKQHLAQSPLQPRDWEEVFLHRRCLATFGMDLYWLLHLLGVLPFHRFLQQVDSAELCSQVHAQFAVEENTQLARAMLADVFSYLYQQALASDSPIAQQVCAGPALNSLP